MKAGWRAYQRGGGWPPGWRWPHRAKVLPVVVALVQVFGTGAGAAHEEVRLAPLAYVLLLIGPAALLVRRRYRVPALVIAAGATAVYYALGYPDGPAFLAALVALFGAVVAGHRAAARVVLAGAYLVYIGIGWVVPGLPRVDWAHALLVAVWLLVAYGFAEAVRVRAANVAEMARARAAWQRAQAERERARAEQQRRRASEERLRIARELHDVLGHHLSLISVQAGVGLHLMDERPEQARAALVAIKQASAEALREVRSVLDAMRPQDESAPRSPAPGLSDVDDLLAGVRAAGFTVRYLSTGLERALPAEVDRAAYRIAQEALTNVRRHAGAGATAELRLDYGPDRLVVHVVDDGVGATHPADGNGIAGMRERAAALGGTLIARARPGGGFEVAADLPIPDDVPAAEFLLTPEQERP